MAKGMADEIKSGMLILACLAILAIFTFALGSFTALEKTYELKAKFNWVSGLEKHAPVRLRGVQVGEVKDVQILYSGDETTILLTLVLKEKAKVREGTKAYVSMLGLMGEKYVEISDGPKGAAFLKPGSIIIGVDPSSMDELIDIGKKVVAEVELTMVDIRKLTNHLDELVVENREDIDFMIDKLKATSTNFEEFSNDIKRHPWKLLMKGKEKKDDDNKDDGSKRRKRRRR